MSKKKKKSVIASLDLKNYKPKYIDPYGDGNARPVGGEELTAEEPPPPEPPLKPEPPPPKPTVEPPKVEPPPKPAPPPVEKIVEPPAQPEPPPKEKFEDIVRRIERNKKKARRPAVEDTPRNVEPVEQTPPPRRVESYGIVISAISLVYAFYVADKAAFFLSMSLLSFLIRPIVGPLFGKHNHAVQNILKGFGIAVFVGAILFIFY